MSEYPIKRSSILDLFFEPSLVETSYSDQKRGFVKWNDESEKFEIFIESAGFKKDDIKIENIGNEIRIHGSISDEAIKEMLGERKMLYVFKRDDIDPESAEASLENGMLKISVSKNKDNKSKVIKIK